jgi:hypothetical protein
MIFSLVESLPAKCCLTHADFVQVFKLPLHKLRQAKKNQTIQRIIKNREIISGLCVKPIDTLLLTMLLPY